VTAGAGAVLVVGLDQRIAGGVGAVGVDAERGYPERPADRAPEAVLERNAVEVVEVDRARGRIGHRAPTLPARRP
jgi:hypothetical protein